MIQLPHCFPVTIGSGKVWFHAAYCTWDPDPRPNIGCNTKNFQILLIEVFEDAGFRGIRFNDWLNHIQETMGTDGWIGLVGRGDNWFFYDSTDNHVFPFDEEEIVA